MNFLLEHIVRKPLVESISPPLLLMLHGYGSHEQDLFSFAQELPEELLIVSARAPMALGFGAYAWYTIRMGEGNSKFSDIQEAIQARELIRSFIGELQQAYQFDKNKISLMGFSQGAILSYAVALSYPNLIRNVIAMSGYLNEEMISDTQSLEHYENLSIFCSHGFSDEVIPVEWARRIPKQLENYGIHTRLFEYSAGHGVAPNNFNDMLSWLQNRL
jgi:phospholipase/carboxylesterase